MVCAQKELPEACFVLWVHFAAHKSIAKLETSSIFLVCYSKVAIEMMSCLMDLESLATYFGHLVGQVNFVRMELLSTGGKTSQFYII